MGTEVDNDKVEKRPSKSRNSTRNHRSIGNLRLSSDHHRDARLQRSNSLHDLAVKPSSSKSRDGLRASTHHSKSRSNSMDGADSDLAGNRVNRSVSEHGATSRSTTPRPKVRQGRRHTTSEVDALASPRSRHSRRRSKDKGEDSRNDSQHRIARVNLSQRTRRSHPLMTPKREPRPSVVPTNVDTEESVKTSDAQAADSDRLLQDMTIKNLELENQTLRNELEQAREIIRQLREQQQRDQANGESVSDLSQFIALGEDKVKSKKKSSSFKPSFWSREKAATLETKRGRHKRDTLLGKLNASYSHVTETIGSTSSGSDEEEEEDKAMAHNVALALEKQTCYRRSTVATPKRELFSGEQHLMTEEMALRPAKTQE